MEVNDPLKTSWTRKKKVSIQNVLCVERNFAWFPIISIFYISVVSTSIESHSCNFLRYRSRVRKVTYLLGTCSSIKLAYERGMLARKGKYDDVRSWRGQKCVFAFTRYHHQLTCVKFIHGLSIVLHFLLGTCVNAWRLNLRVTAR